MSDGIRETRIRRRPAGNSEAFPRKNEPPSDGLDARAARGQFIYLLAFARYWLNCFGAPGRLQRAHKISVKTP